VLLFLFHPKFLRLNLTVYVNVIVEKKKSSTRTRYGYTPSPACTEYGYGYGYAVFGSSPILSKKTEIAVMLSHAECSAFFTSCSAGFSFRRYARIAICAAWSAVITSHRPSDHSINPRNCRSFVVTLTVGSHSRPNGFRSFPPNQRLYCSCIGLSPSSFRCWKSPPRMNGLFW